MGENLISVLAADGAVPPNIGRAEIRVTRRNPGPPALSITHPADGVFLASSAVTVAGRVSSESPEVSLTVTVNGQPATLAGGEFTRSINLVDGLNAITVVAIDSLGQSASQTISVTCDLTSPQVSLVSLPSIVLPGASYLISAEASDNYRLTSVELSIDGQKQAVFETPPFEFTYVIPESRQPGERISVSVLAWDASGRIGVDSGEMRVAGPGGVAGRVFDDVTGYPLPDVTVVSTDGASAESGTDGAWFFVSPLSQGVARFVKPEHTPCERDFSLEAGQGSWLLDARLTPVDDRSNEIGPNGGEATGDSGRLRATIAAGTFTSTLDVRLTAVSPQGLMGVLPFGWSPVPGAVVDFRPLDGPPGAFEPFSSPVHLVISPGAATSGLPEALPDWLALVFYDESAHCWYAVESRVQPGADGSLSAYLDRFGQYAFVVPDSGATAPPAPIRGEALASGSPAAHSALSSAVAFATASPPIALYSPEARSIIRITADPSVKIPSGIWCEASFDERYDLRAQTEPKLVERAAQTFVMYSYPAASLENPNRLAATFPATPTILDLPLADFRAANLRVAIRPAEPDPGQLVGPSGATIRVAGGAELVLPPGALHDPTPVFLKALGADELALGLPEGFEILGGALLDLSGRTLASSAQLSLPDVSADSTRVVLARVITVGDRRGPKLVGRAIKVNGRLQSTITPPAMPAGLAPGITEGGIYVFVKMPKPFGYLTGTVTNAFGPVAAVRVSADTNPFLDLTPADGRYLLPGQAGIGLDVLNQLSAAALNADETGSAVAALTTEDSHVETIIQVASTPLAVASITPPPGSVDIPVSTSIRVSFTKPITEASLTGSSFRVTTASGHPVAGMIVVLPGRQAATFTPSAALVPGGGYRVTLTTAVRDLYGHPLAADFSSSFTTAAVQPAASQLTAAAVSISCPDSSGYVTITIPAGRVPPGSTVIALNHSRGSTSTVMAGTGPLALRLLAHPGDDIRIIVRQPSGVDYEVVQGAFRSPDGFAAVGPSGGTVTSADGAISLVIEPGSIKGLAEIRLSYAPESSITIPRLPGTPMDPANVPFGAGVRIETRGNFTLEKELHVEVAAPPGLPEGRRAICLTPSHAIDPETGEEVEVWESVTSAVVSQGRFKTTSLPFMGVYGVQDTFMIYFFTPVYSHVLWGWVRDGCEVGRPPVAGVLCMSPAAGPTLRGQVTARTNRDGLYALFDVTMAPPTNIVRFFDEVNHRQASSGTNISGFGPQTGELVKFLEGLQGFSYANVDGLLPCPAISFANIPPVLNINARQVNLEPGAGDPLPDLGIARPGAVIEIIVDSDQPLSPIRGTVSQGGPVAEELEWQVLTPDCTAGCRYSAILEAPAEGGYLVEVTGYGVGGVGRADYQFVVLRDPNFRPPLEGPPFVLSVSPKDRAVDVDIMTEIRLEFSEPVRNLSGQGASPTVFLEAPDGSITGGEILSGGLPVTPESSVSSIVFKPESALVGGKTYVLHVTIDVVDSNDERLNQDPDDDPEEFTSSFTTYAGAQLSHTPENPGLRVSAEGRYAFVLEPDSLFSSNLVAYDTVDPRYPKQLSRLRLPQYAIDLAVSSETQYVAGEGVVSRIGVVTAVCPSLPDRAANLWIINLDDPEGLSDRSIIGVVSLYFPQDLSAVPVAVALHNGRAYIGNAPYRGLIVVDVEWAISLWHDAVLQGWENPQYKAVTPYAGFGQEAIVQSLLYQSNDPSIPAMATAVSVITQDVPGEDGWPAGAMPVAFAIDSGSGAVLAAGMPNAFDGVHGFLGGGSHGDRRILSWIQLGGAYPLAVQAVADFGVGSQRRDLVLVLTSEDLRIYDATSHPMTLLAVVSRAEQGIAGATSHLAVEDGLVYISSSGGLSVVDFSKPTAPRLVTAVSGDWAGSTSVSVRNGFVHSVSTSSGYAIGIARPVAQVFVHGLTGQAGQLCSNPVILDRHNPDHPMLYPAEILFQIFGKKSEMETAQVLIRKGEEVVSTLTAALADSPDYDLKTGSAIWYSERVDLTSEYTAQIVLEEYETERTPIPMSFLVGDYQATVQVQPQGPLVEQVEVSPYAYVLAANAVVTISVGSGFDRRETRGWRAFGLNSERLDLAGLEVGRYELRLRAELPDGYAEEIVGALEIASNPNDVRVPNHTIVGGIDLATGHLGLTYTDVMIKGRGLSLEFTRSYNQGAANVFSPLGYGWHHNYQMLLVHNRHLGLYTIIGGDAQGETFPEAPHVMRSLSPFHTTLVRNDDGSFDYYNKAHIKHHFPGALERDSYSYYRQSYMGNLDYVADGYDNRIDLRYDTLGRLVQVIDASGRALNFEYEEALAPFVGVVLPFLAGHSSSTCVADGRLPVIRDHFATSASGKAWRIRRITGPGGLEIEYRYDEDGNLESVRRLGTAVSIPGGEEGQPGVESEASEDYVWSYAYKPSAGGSVPAENLTHLLREIISPNGSKTAYEFNQNVPTLPIAAVHYPEGVGNSFTYTFDGIRVASVDVTDGRGIPTTYKLDREKVISILVAGTQTSFEYDHKKGLKIQETDPGGMVRRYFHDDNGNVIRLEQTGSAGGKQTRILTRATFDPTFNRPVARWDANSQRWDAVRQAWVEDDRGMTSYTLNYAGDVESVRFSDGSTMRFEYDDLGQLRKVIDRLGLITEYQAYDPYGNPQTIVQQTERDATGNVKTVVTTNSWDEISRLVSTSSTLGPTITYSYDKLDRVVRSVTEDPSGVRTPLSVEYEYRMGGQLSKETKQTTSRGSDGAVLEQSHVISYTYDGLDRRTGIQESGNGGVSSVRSFGYDGNSNLVWETNRRGIRSQYVYNDLNFLERHEIEDRLESDPEPDLVGNPRSVIDRYGNVSTLKYDGVHRLIGRAQGGYAESWELDGNGNIIAFWDRNGRKTTFEYDGLNRVTKRVDPLGRETTWQYSIVNHRHRTVRREPHRGLTVTTERDALDRVLLEKIECASCSGSPYVTTWDYQGLKVDIRDPRGNTIRRELSAFGETGSISLGRDKTIHKYTGLGGLYSLTDGRGKEWRYELDGLNRVLVTHHPEVDSTRAPPVPIEESFTYDGEGNLIRHSSRRGVETIQTYDHLGRVLTRRVGQIEVDRFSYHDPAFAVTRTDANNHATTFRYDPLGRLLSVTNALGEAKSFRWDGENLTGETDFRGNETSYAYDELNRLTRVTDRLGHATTIVYKDDNGLTRTITDGRGGRRVEVYDGLDRLIKEERGGEDFASCEYDGNDNLTRHLDGEGRVVAYEYGVENWVEKADHAGLRTQIFSRDNVGNLVAYFDGAGGTIEQVFDGLGRVVSRKDGLGNETRWIYDGELLRGRIDPLGNETRYEYNEQGSLTVVQDALQNTWTYAYDPAQNLVKVTDPLDVDGNRATSYIRDALNRIETVKSALGRERSYAYDANSNLTSRIDPKGQVRSTSYDAEDQAIEITVSSASGELLSWAYSYDPEGNLVGVRETTGGKTRSYGRTYDQRNRPIEATDPFGRSVGFGYDRSDQVVSFRDAANRLTTYAWDGARRLESATLPGGSTIGFTWRADNLLEEVRYPGQMVRRYRYDEADRLTALRNEIGPGHSEEFVYGYDANSNRVGEIRLVDGEVRRELSYGYDELDRLIRADYGGGSSVEYSYDAVGNRQTETGQDPSGRAVSRTYTYNEANELTAVTDELHASRSLLISYDANGNLEREESSSGQVRNFEHDGLDWLRRVTESSRGVVGIYDYDFQGRRISRDTPWGLTQYVYRGEEIHVTNEFDRWDRATASYEFAEGLIRAEFGEGERWYFSDALGSTTSLGTLTPSGEGTPVERHEYDAWGGLIPAVPLGQTISGGSNRVLYTGYRRDDETGLDYALARYYDHRFGRFLQQDPLPDIVEQARARAVAAFTYEALAAAPALWTSPEFEGREAKFDELVHAGSIHNRLRALDWVREEIAPPESTGSRMGNQAGRSVRKETVQRGAKPFTGYAKGGTSLPDVVPATLVQPPSQAFGSGPGMWNRYPYAGSNPLNRTDPDGRQAGELAKKFEKWMAERQQKIEEWAIASGDPEFAAGVTFWSRSAHQQIQSDLSWLHYGERLGEVWGEGTWFERAEAAFPHLQLLRVGQAVGSLSQDATPQQKAEAWALDIGRASGLTLVMAGTARRGISRLQAVAKTKVVNYKGEPVKIPEGHVMSSRDPSFAEPPIVEYGPFTSEQRQAFLRGRSGGTRIAFHHRHQIPTTYGGVIDEVPGPKHPRGNVHTAGTPTRHPSNSVFRSIEGGEKLRALEIRLHLKAKGARLVEVETGVWIDPGPK
ncbi:MAG TPA: Ig-like domain-containing protein [Acidobacteriota bacterium]|nr:Ig-like domain-containing protein [Acidobacteriota bacterium]